MPLSVGLETPLQVRALDGVGGLARLKPIWNRLADELPLQRWEWADAWWQRYGTTRRLFTLVITESDPDDVLGLVPLCVERHWLAGRVLRPLGTGEAGTDHAAILALPGWERPVAEAAALWLAAQSHRRWDRLQLARFETRLIANYWFLHTLEQVGLRVERGQSQLRWRIALTPTWNTFLQWLPKTTRSHLREVETRWLLTGRARLTPSYGTEFDEATVALLHAGPYELRGVARNATNASIRERDFTADLARRMNQLRQLRLWSLEADGQAVGAWCGFGRGETLYAYLSSVAECAAAPAWRTVLLAHALRQAIEQGYQYVDLGYLPESPALAWRAEPQTVCDVDVIPARGPAQWRHRAQRAWHRIKQWRLPR
ncbi:MAG: GNAT family N-acetyltransferase [Planctomycetaceae bacterium]|nr:GNAT family N-acetyltransferase [Planctomycetaceae bacterium]